MKRSSVLSRLSLPILACALLVCGASAFRWMRASALREHFNRAEAFVGQRRGPEAEAEWKAVLRDDPKNAAAWELLGEYYMSRHQWPAGADAFRKLAQADPKKPHVQCRLAACLLRMDDQLAAFETAKGELRHDPNCVAALGLVTSLMAQRPGTEQKQLLEYQRQLAKLIPNDPSIQRMLAETLTDQYLFDELRPVVAQMLKLNPQDAEAYNLLGFADLARADQPQGAQAAIEDFQNSLQRADNNSGAHFGLGRAYLIVGPPQKAVTELEQAARQLPGVARVQKELVNAYRAANQPQQAMQAQVRLAALQKLSGEERILSVRCIAYPKDPDYPRRLGELYLKVGEPSRAIFYLTKAKQLRPDDPQIASLLATANATALRQTASNNGFVR